MSTCPFVKIILSARKLRSRKPRRTTTRTTTRARHLSRCPSTRQATLPLQALQRAYTSELHRTNFTKLLKPQPRRRHRVAHHAAHRWEPCEICGVVEILRSENVRDDDVVEKAGDGIARGSIAFALSLTRAGFHTECRAGEHSDTCGCRVRVVVRRGFLEVKNRRGKGFCARLFIGRARNASSQIWVARDGAPVERSLGSGFGGVGARDVRRGRARAARARSSRVAAD